MRIPTEPIGSIPGPPALIEAVSKRSGNDPALVPLYEEAFRTQSEWLRITLASIGDAVVSTDAEGRITFMNGVAESVSGYLQAEALGRPFPEVLTIIDSQTRQRIDNNLEKVLREDRTFLGLANQTVLIAKDATERPINNRVAPIRDKNGQIIGVVLVFQDLSGRKQAEEAKAHLAAIVESSDDAIISKNLQGILMSWNKGAEKLFGYRAAEAVGKPVTMLIPTQHVDEEPRILEKIRHGETVDHYETVRVRKDGTAIDISLTVSPIRDETGKIIGASKIARDITGAKTGGRRAGSVAGKRTRCAASGRDGKSNEGRVSRQFRTNFGRR